MSAEPDPSSNSAKSASGRRSGRRRAARLAAVQALYEIDVAGAEPEPVLNDFLARRWAMNAAGDVAEEGASPLVQPDPEFLADLVRGVATHTPALDERIGPWLDGEWTVERLEVLLRAILRAGTYELAERLDVPAETVINEYVDVAHAFFAGREPGLTNAVLDKVARALRPGELDGKAETKR